MEKRLRKTQYQKDFYQDITIVQCNRDEARIDGHFIMRDECRRFYSL